MPDIQGASTSAYQKDAVEAGKLRKEGTREASETGEKGVADAFEQDKEYESQDTGVALRPHPKTSKL